MNTIYPASTSMRTSSVNLSTRVYERVCRAAEERGLTPGEWMEQAIRIHATLATEETPPVRRGSAY